MLSLDKGNLKNNFRTKYLSAIRTGYKHLSNEEEWQKIPKNVIDESQFLQDLPFDRDTKGKHGSLTNIFSCWNGMVGSGLVFVPWAFSNSGIILGSLLVLVAFVMSFTT